MGDWELDNLKIEQRARYLGDLYRSIPKEARLVLTDKGSQYILDNIGHLNTKERGTIQNRVDILLDIGNTGDSSKIGKLFRWSTVGHLLELGLIDYE